MTGPVGKSALHRAALAAAATASLVAIMLSADGGSTSALAAPLDHPAPGLAQQETRGGATPEAMPDVLPSAEPAGEEGSSATPAPEQQASEPPASPQAPVESEAGQPPAPEPTSGPVSPVTGKAEAAGRHGALPGAGADGPGTAASPREDPLPESEAGSYSMVRTTDPAEGATLWPGESVTYTITVANTGAHTATGIVITEEMSGWQRAATIDEDSLRLSGGTSTVDGSRILWAVGDLAAGESRTLSYLITVKEAAWDQLLVAVATGTGTVPAAKSEHATAEYHRIDDPGPEIIAPTEPTAVPMPPDDEVVPAPKPRATRTAAPKPLATQSVAPNPPVTRTAAAAQVTGQEQPRGGPLPETGPGAGTLAAAGIGGAAMAAGLGLLLVSRRRGRGARH